MSTPSLCQEYIKQRTAALHFQVPLHNRNIANTALSSDINVGHWKHLMCVCIDNLQSNW